MFEKDLLYFFIFRKKKYRVWNWTKKSWGIICGKMCLNRWSQILGGDRCLRLDYAISDRNIGGAYTTSLTVTAVMGSTTATETMGSTGNAWRSFEMSLEAADDLKVS